MPNQEPEKTGSPDAGFARRPVEQPILSSTARSQLAGSQPAAQPASPAAGPGFYQTNKYYLWAIAGGLSVIGVLAYFAFRAPKPTSVQEAQIELAVTDTPETAPSGGELVYKVKVENKDSRKLVGQELELTYPAEFSYLSSQPKAENLSGTLFKIPDLSSGQNVIVLVKVKTAGSINDQKKLKFKLNYKLDNFSSSFNKEGEFDVRLVAADIDLAITGPQNTSSAQLVTYDIKYKNNSRDDVSNARIRINFPDGFSYAASQPNPDLGNNVWNIASLPSGQEGGISVQGSYKGAGAGESKTVTAEFLIISRSSGEYFTQNTASVNTQLSSLPLLISQEVEGAESGVVSPGQTLRFTLKYQNNAATEARGVTIQASLDSKALDLSTLRGEGALVDNSTLSWNASGVQQLTSLSPGESGNISFSVRLKDPATRDSSKNLLVNASVKIKSSEYETFFPGNDLSLKISSPAQVLTQLSFVSGSQPPRVGSQTVYKASISLKNSSNDFSSAVVSMFLPLGAGSYDAGSLTPSETSKVTFDPSTGKLTWNVGSLPAHSGAFSPAKILEFQVRLNPSAGQAGQSPVLVKGITLDATDTFTSQAVSVKGDDLDTTDAAGNYGGQVLQ